MADGITASNGLAFSPDGAMMCWADTKAHAVDAFEPKVDDPMARQWTLKVRTGSPCSKGNSLLRFAPDGQLLTELPLPVRCPTMPCFGGTDLRTLYITTARDERAAEELATQPLAGCVLQWRIDLPGLPAHPAQL